MTPEEFQRQLDAAREQRDAQSAVLKKRVEQLRQRLARAEDKLLKVGGEYTERVIAISRIYSGAEEMPAPKEEAAVKLVKGGNGGGRKRKKKGSLDVSILRLAAELSKPDCTIPGIMAEWNATNADKITRSTVRRIFERHKVPVVFQGSAGNANPTRYRVSASDLSTNGGSALAAPDQANMPGDLESFRTIRPVT
jgi:hypothetical protein